ncbi:fluoride efflux transporter CrcB [Falsibacillus albus]|uniref:Fluoride-specific ion channel FluC n=1 Tax=Falsibacillus albus TaxID=2478915 RepID=A0A3L7JTZ0_9BACI|nr:fluoride efflux transporter CrcB [Falsibacillus albus]RLQ93755.1 fluoride efflux transporter CrcB [Falsibacillus albus]
MNVLLIAVGGFFGAIARYSISLCFKKVYPTTFPLATLTVNLLGAFLLGILVGSGMASSAYSLLGTGFMGAFTTFSTFKLENIQLREGKNHSTLISYLLVTYTIGISAAFLGIHLGSSL